MMSNDSREFAYGRPARPPQVGPTTYVQWATGLPVAGSRHVYAGWFVECDRDPALDDAMNDAGIERIAIQHRESGVKRHWSLETAAVVPLATHLPAWSDLVEDHTSGIAFAWSHRDGRTRSHMRLHVVVQPLLDVGYATPIVLSVSGTLTRYLYHALMRQYDVLDAAEALMRARGQTIEYPFYAFALPIGPGDPVDVGKRERKSVTPPVALVPQQCDEIYLRTYTIRAHRAAIETLLPAAIAWCATESRRLAAHNDQ